MRIAHVALVLEDGAGAVGDSVPYPVVPAVVCPPQLLDPSGRAGRPPQLRVDLVGGRAYVSFL